MKEALLGYYERELRFIRKMAQDFGNRYPAIASQLLIEPDKCEDPHVERLIEAFAMLTARVQMKLDSEYPEITESFLNLLYPNYLAPLPSATIVKLLPDSDRADATIGITVDRHSLLHTRPIDAVRCRFRTCYETTLWPVTVTEADLISLGRNEPACPAGAVGAVRLRLKTLGGQSWSELPVESLRFFLDGDAQLVHQLYELFFTRSLGLVIRPEMKRTATLAERQPSTYLGPDSLRPVGFAKDETIFGSEGSVALGYRMLQEYFAFPDKFMFVDFCKLDFSRLPEHCDTLEILVILDELPHELEGRISPDNFQLGCTPAVNLFPYQAEPIRLTHAASEYQVVPNSQLPAAYEIHSVLEVETFEPNSRNSREIRPFYTFRQDDPADDEPAFWQINRRPSLRKDDDGTELFLTLVDRQTRILDEPPGETLNIRILCSNRDLPSRMTVSQNESDFIIEGQPSVSGIRTLRKPTRSQRIHLQNDGHWRLISLLNMNHISLARLEDDPDMPEGLVGRYQGPVAFRELLSLLDFSESAAGKQRITGLLDITARRVLRQVTVQQSRIFARGLEVTLTLDESKFIGSGVFLFGALLEQFFGLYTSMNSFTQTILTVRQREGVLKKWQPRTGGIQLL